MKQVQPFPRASERGVTMIEMIIVLAIISVISLVTVPGFISMYQSARVKATVRGMITDVRNARQLAIANNTRTRISYKLGTNIHEYEVFRERKNRLDNTSTWDRVKWGNLGAVVYIQTSNFADGIADPDGMRDIIFRANGTLDPASLGTPVPAQPWQVTLQTDQPISKPTYRMEFTATGNVVLR